MIQRAGLIGEFDESRLRRVRRLCLIIALILTAAFAAAVFLFARYGGGFVDSLSGRVGEVVAARAQSLADSGQPQAAANAYAEALRARFDDPQQQVWCYRRYGETLMELQQWQKAAEAFRGALALNPKDWPSHRRLCDALKKQGLMEPMRTAARDWLHQAAGNDVQTKMAEQYLQQ